MRTPCGKVSCELVRDHGNPLEHAALETTGPEFHIHVVANSGPTLGTDVRVDAAIGDDLDLAVGKQDIDQDAVVVRGVPDPQMRKDVESALARRLIVEQRRAIERAFDDKPELAGMGCLAGLDRGFDPREHGRRKQAPRAPAVFEQMLADAFDAHGHQLPDAPPPPKPPPPPENPPPPPPPLQPPPPPDQPPPPI